ncbi:MAG: arginine--tRNA ligase [Patescibacteria group bacterium]|jgi:arginyl-tRNA synthetase|nr:arginine--tRNA ligase [Patescibacteria group bacterium]
MYYIDRIKELIKEELSVKEIDFSYPSESKFGDLSFACFVIAKQEKTNPVQLANDYVKKIKNSGIKDYFSDVKAVGPYINFFFSNYFLAINVISEIKKENEYGFKPKNTGRKIMIEYSNGNTHKEYHVGHLRNIAYGDSVKNILIANSNKVYPVSYINDFGIHVAKTIWNWQKNPVFEERPEDKGYLLGKCYSEASRKLNKEKEEGIETGKEEVSSIMTSIEKRSGGDYELWKKTRDWSVNYFNNIYKELNISFKETYFESEMIEKGLKIVDDLVEKNILTKSKGAIIADLEKYDLGVLPVIRSDKTALYPVADLALASKKFEEYDLDESIYVVDVRQSLYFKQLFKLIELSGYDKKLTHLSYDFVTLPEGMMASRTGNVITYEDLKNNIYSKIYNETKKRHDNWSEKKIEKVSMSLTISIIKFEMLKVGAEKTITFDIDEAARFEGFTACYLQYTYARASSLIRKSGFKIKLIKTDFESLKTDKEKELLVKMARFKEAIEIAAKRYNPSELAKYVFELAQIFNDYYHETNILKADTRVKEARIQLIKSLSKVLSLGFSLLGIETLEEM